RCRSRPELREHRIVVRLHPLDTGERWIAFARRHPEVILSYPWAPSREAWTAQDQARFVSTIAHADVCINFASTMSLDAAMVDTPVVCAAFGIGRDRAEDRFCREVYRTDHYRPIVESGGVRLAGDM